MFCPNCGTNLPDGTPVCTTCGRQLNAPQQSAPQQPAPQQSAPQPVYQQPAYQQPVYQQPVYQAPVRPISITKKEYLATKAPASVKQTAGFVIITLILTLALVVGSAIVPLAISIFDVPMVDTIFNMIDDESADPDLLLEELERSYVDAKLQYRLQKDFWSKSEREDAEKALDALEKVVDSFSILNLMSFLDVAADLVDNYSHYDLGVSEEEIESYSAAMMVIIIVVAVSFLLPFALTLIAGLTKSTGCTIAALIFTVLNQLVLCGFLWVLLSLALFIIQAVICSKVNKAYQDYRMGRAAA